MNGTPQTIGRYVIRERLGMGGMGVVYLALDPAIDRLVALKALAVESPELRERFLREAGLAGRLQHPNIVTVYDVGTHEGQPFIAMEYIAGESLAGLVRRRAPLSLKRKLEIVVDACKGLAFAHRNGILHRDVKPANLMMRRDSGTVKVLDFGIARGLASTLTQAGVVMGTPNYMSPEQLQGGALDPRSDMFGLGLVLYEMLCYRQAFSGETPRAISTQIALTQPASLLDLDPTLDPVLMDIFTRSTAKRMEDRYSDLDALRVELQRVIQRIESVQEGDTLVDGIPITAIVPPPRRPDMARLAERRATQIAAHLRRADEAAAAGEIDRAHEAAEEAAILDPDDPRVLVLLERLKRELDTREATAWVADADAAIRAGELAKAGALIARMLELVPDHPAALALHATLQQRFDAHERAEGHLRAIARALEEAETHAASGALQAALRATSEALGYDPSHAGALAARAQLQEMVQQHNAEVVGQARADFAAKRYTDALNHLQRARPRDERVAALEAEVHRALRAESHGLDGNAPAVGQPHRFPTAPLPTPRPTPTAVSPSRQRSQVPVDEYLARARRFLAANQFARSMSLVDTALALEPQRAEAHDLRRHIDEAWAADEIGRQGRSGQAGA